MVKYPKIMERVQVKVERYLEQVVKDPELRAKLTPDYTIGCKRVATQTFANSFNRLLPHQIFQVTFG